MDGVTIPYEFAFSEETQSEASHKSFFQDFSSLLCNIGLENVLGVRLLDSYDLSRPIEMTEGKKNIMMPRGSVPDADLIEALWVFSTGETQSCHCREYCFTRDRKHVANHGCS